MERNSIAIGKRIRSIREELGMTTEEFAECFTPPASKGTVSKWENGHYLPNNKRLVKIAELKGITVDELLHGLIDERIYSVAGDLIAESKLPAEQKEDAINKVAKQLKMISERGGLNDQTIRAYVESELAGAEVLHALSGKVDVTEIRWLNPLDSEGYTTEDYIKALIYNIDFLIEQTQVQINDLNKDELSKSLEHLLNCKRSLENQLK